MRVYDIISSNIDAFKNMVKIGAVPVHYLNYYNIYCVFKSSENMPSRMDRYYFTSEVTKNSVSAVRNAVATMERPA